MPEDLFQFEDFVLNCGAYELRRGDVVVPLQRIPLELLCLLVERRGQLVTREEILERVWGKGVFVDPLWRGNHVAVTQLADDFAQYLYLPRLRGSDVLTEAVRDGLRIMTWAQDSFAYADSFDEAKGRYVGLKAGQLVTVAIDGAGGLVVKAEIAKAQLEAEAKPEDRKIEKKKDDENLIDDHEDKKPVRIAPLARRFHGSVGLSAIRISRDAGQIADEVIQHLTKLPGSNVEVTIEIQAEIPEGAPESVVRTVSENCRTLKFRSFDFEES